MNLAKNVALCDPYFDGNGQGPRGGSPDIRGDTMNSQKPSGNIKINKGYIARQQYDPEFFSCCGKTNFQSYSKSIYQDTACLGACWAYTVGV